MRKRETKARFFRCAGFIVGAVFMSATLTACGTKTTENKDETIVEQVVSQADTQTTDVLSALSMPKISSENIDSQNSGIDTSYQKDAEIEKMLTSGKYTWKNPKVMLNPYGNSPLTAYILFQTDKACKIKMTVVGKSDSTTISATFSKGKNHRIPVVGLYPDKENEIVLSSLEERERSWRKRV